MPSRDKQSQYRFDWPAIVKTLSVEIVVLLALATAYVGYLNWSSEVNVREFMAASRSAATDPADRPRSRISVPVIETRANCGLEI
ncbi:MAG TPA: hypothetical protein VFC46_02775 [Humisphaera sp.]|nr:hypothetical protein [Humisphaera sp.]